MDISLEFRNFVAGAIQYQFAQHNIWPTTLSAEYLDSEPSFSVIDAAPPEQRQSMSVHFEPFWRLD
jgi:hypothetical protein